MATHSSILAWKIPWMEEPGRLQSMGSQRVGFDWATSLSLCNCTSGLWLLSLSLKSRGRARGISPWPLILSHPWVARLWGLFTKRVHIGWVMFRRPWGGCLSQWVGKSPPVLSERSVLGKLGIMMAAHGSQDSYYSRSQVEPWLHASHWHLWVPTKCQPDARIDQKPCSWRSLRWADAVPWGQRLQTRLEKTQRCFPVPALPGGLRVSSLFPLPYFCFGRDRLSFHGWLLVCSLNKYLLKFLVRSYLLN